MVLPPLCYRNASAAAGQCWWVAKWSKQPNSKVQSLQTPKNKLSKYFSLTFMWYDVYICSLIQRGETDNTVFSPWESHYKTKKIVETPFPLLWWALRLLVVGVDWSNLWHMQPKQLGKLLDGICLKLNYVAKQWQQLNIIKTAFVGQAFKMVL